MEANRARRPGHLQAMLGVRIAANRLSNIGTPSRPRPEARAPAGMDEKDASRRCCALGGRSVGARGTCAGVNATRSGLRGRRNKGRGPELLGVFSACQRFSRAGAGAFGARAEISRSATRRSEERRV